MEETQGDNAWQLWRINKSGRVQSAVAPSHRPTVPQTSVITCDNCAYPAMTLEVLVAPRNRSSGYSIYIAGGVFPQVINDETLRRNLFHTTFATLTGWWVWLEIISGGISQRVCPRVPSRIVGDCGSDETPQTVYYVPHPRATNETSNHGTLPRTPRDRTARPQR